MCIKSLTCPLPLFVLSDPTNSFLLPSPKKLHQAMDFQIMQWRTQQHQSDQQQKQQQAVDNLATKQNHHQHQHQSLSALPLFLTEPPVSKLGSMSDTPSTPKFPKMMMTMGGGGQGQQHQFSSAQWKELELQAVIFRYMLAGASVPDELLQPIKNSLLNSSSFFLHHPLHHHFPLYQPAAAAASLQSGYWSRVGMDPEPGRCRRTDGKKWRCSRDVALGHKYCERHMNRGRNRSRKPVEIPRPRTVLNPSPVNAGGGEKPKTTAPMMGSSLGAASKAHFSSFGVTPSMDMLHLNHGSSDMSIARKSPFELSHGAGSDGRVLRPFFDDWPRSMTESGFGGNNASTSLSMSIRGNSGSDVSLKLSTGSENEESNADRDRMQLNWMAQWGQHQAGPMGGPLAEALRSSASHD